ncbi:MAG: SIMPL domain-containing protein [Candidatus Micrarchaeota archaeon]|nr:SIMPL domain-containing protein [Candidatus Micrarchaeota archaeon]
MKAEMKLAEFAVLGVIIIAALLVIGLVWVLPAVSSVHSGNIAVYATGAAYSVPTQSVLYITVNATGNTTQAATQNLASELSSFNTTVARFINNNWTLVSTQSYNIYKIYNMSGYRATESIALTLPNISDSGAAIGALSSIQNVFVTNIQTSMPDWQITMLRTSALQYALQNATSQARALAGNSPISVANISINSYNVFPYSGYLANSAQSAASNPAFYTGRSKVVEAITVNFNYKSG